MKKFLTNSQTVLVAIEESGHTLEYPDPELKKDKQLLLAVVKQNGWEFLSKKSELKLGTPETCRQ